MAVAINLQAAILPLFIVLGSVLAWVCRRQLVNPGCHGFYRFFAFAGILWLFLNALQLWHHDITSISQILSLLLMLSALGLLIGGVYGLRCYGGTSARRQAEENFRFENTSTLVTRGIYAYIRHPMYSSLLLLNGGLVLKRPELDAIAVALLVTLALYLTARTEERENCDFFGSSYRDYLQHSKMFLPYLW
ncbi:methyltransferase family protein [Halopseudomonas salegens]|uniref:Protein-S-isoprenylcysteine O-methyltransferase Ste14 n=1 Tax=Halopseudomonas salegens TaxID=1434072 RepID=A0A1H2GVR3_9GAMM|nr:methyltransferase [Halopseudomonas salegens]SDU23378.1 Protein-S-isoprenylcysteine O-methyltransferase Ste14 [Halopseudomonas salegens]